MYLSVTSVKPRHQGWIRQCLHIALGRRLDHSAPSKKWMAKRKMERPCRAFKRIPVEKGDMFLNFRGVKVKKNGWTLIGTTLKILNLDGWNLEGFKMLKRKSSQNVSIARHWNGNAFIGVAPQLIKVLAFRRFQWFRWLSYDSSPFSSGNASFLAPISS